MLKNLTEEDRQIVLYRLHWDLAYAEISKIMNLSVFTVQKRYQRAIKKLREEIV